MLIQISLTSAEQKFLVGKAVANMDCVKKAYREGIVGLPLCTTNTYVVEELTGREIPRGRYACGIIVPRGTCTTDPELMSAEVVIEKGEVKELDFPRENLFSYMEKMGPDDVVVKSGNALDQNGKAAVMVAEYDGGEIGKCLPSILAKGIKLVVPMTFDKLISTSVEEAVKEGGIRKIDWSMGIPVSVLPLPGIVVTPSDAIKILTGAKSISIGAGGTGGAQGSTTMLIKGAKMQVTKAKKLIEKAKEEPNIPAYPFNCERCEEDCPRAASRKG